MVQITPLLHAIPVLSHFGSTDSTSGGLAVRQSSIDPSSLPSACQSPCQVITTMADCNGTLDCVCVTSVGSQLEQCMSCLVDAEPSVESEAQSAISSWNEACSGNLSLGNGSGSSETATSTASATSPSETGTSSSGDSNSNPSDSKGNGASGLKTGGMVACIVAVLSSAFIFL